MRKTLVICIIIISIFVLGTIFYLAFNNYKNANNRNNAGSDINDFVSLKIICDGETSHGQYKVGDTFQYSVLDEDFEIKIDDISNEKIDLSSSEYGLFPLRDDGTISLNDKVKKFKLYPDKELNLRFQAADIDSGIIIIWE